MDDFLCTTCWRVVPVPKAFFECSACASGSGSPLPQWARPRKRVRRRVSELGRPVSQRLGFGARRLPRCPRHPQTELRFFCPCGRPLSPEILHVGDRPSLAIAGPRSSGKTLLTITMIDELRGQQVNGQRIGLLGIGDTETRFEKLAEPFHSERQSPKESFPEPPQEIDESDDGAVPQSYSWRIYVGDDGGAAGNRDLLTIYDVAGETWNLDSSESRPRLDRYLDLAGALAFLIDGRGVAADLGRSVEDAWDPQAADGRHGAVDRQVFRYVTDRLGRGVGSVDLALVVSKADHLWEAGELSPPGSAKPEEIDESLAELLSRAHRSDLIAAARDFKSFRLFAASSLGFVPRPGDVDEQRRLTRPPTPVGVTGPLTWLLQRRERI